MTTETKAAPAKSAFAVTVADLRCRYRRDGLRILLGKIAGRVRAAMYSVEEVIVLKKDLPQITEMASSEALRIEDVNTSHLPALYEFNFKRCNSKADARAAAALERGYRGYVGYVGDQLVGYYWWVDAAIDPNHSDISHHGLGIELQPGEVYGFDFYLLEEHRDRGRPAGARLRLPLGLRRRRQPTRALALQPARVQAGEEGRLPFPARAAEDDQHGPELKHAPLFADTVVA